MEVGYALPTSGLPKATLRKAYAPLVSFTLLVFGWHLLMAPRLWSLGVFLVAIGIAAHLVGWETLLWIPRTVMDWLAWIPAEIIGAVRASPATTGLILLGIVLMVVARVMMRRRG